MNSSLEIITPAALRDHPLPQPGASKASRGTVLVVGGSAATPGAVALAGLAALRVGAGVLALAVPEVIAIPLAVSVPESGVWPWTVSTNGLDELVARVRASDSVLVGPGLDDPDIARRLIALVAAETPGDVPVVLDAYALGALPGEAESAKALGGRLVLSPNQNEAERLLERSCDGLTDEDVAVQVAERWSAVVVYQGLVAAPGQPTATVATGHGGLGTSGSGDVLAGAIAGAIARGADPRRAACWAAYLHAAAGDRLASRIGRVGFLARELVDELPLVMAELDT